jgi:hypothetical protein
MPRPINDSAAVPAPRAAGAPPPLQPPIAASPPDASVSVPSPSNLFICCPTGRSSPPPPTTEVINAAVAEEARLNEEEGIAESVDLSGGHSDIDVVAARTPSSKKKKAVPGADATTREVIDYFRHNATVEQPMPCDEELLISIQQELQTHASTPCHVSRMKSKSGVTKCNCLRVLFYDESTSLLRSNILKFVGNYALVHMKSNKFDQDQSFIDMYRNSQHIPTGKNNTNFFAVPFNRHIPQAHLHPITLTGDEIALLNQHKI